MVYQQHVRGQAPRGLVRLSTGWVPAAPVVPVEFERRSLKQLLADPRNLADVTPACHGAHHGGSRRLPCRVLPDSVFEFAVELFEAPGAYAYLSRRYAGPDPRLDLLVAA